MAYLSQILWGGALLEWGGGGLINSAQCSPPGYDVQYLNKFIVLADMECYFEIFFFRGGGLIEEGTY